MTDLDSLRQALHAPLPGRPGWLDTREIIAQGRRVRRQRRVLTIGGWSACLTAALTATVYVAGLTGGPAATHPRGLPSFPATSPGHQVPDARPGAMIRSRFRTAIGELVFSPVTVTGVPGTRFGVMAGYRHLGRVSEVAESNETQGSATSPGFHAIEAATRVNGTQVPEFGYYAGPVATVTGRFGRKTVRAGLAPLSGHPGVFVFWFTSQHDATHLAAYNAAGTRLPSGHTRAGVG